MPLIQDTPLITVYRSGIVNLNGEATRLMHDRHKQIDLMPPVRARQPWQLDRREGASCNLLAGGRSGSHLRFSAPYRAAELFREQPHTVQRILFRLVPSNQHPDLYTLAAELPLFSPQHCNITPPRKKKPEAV